MYLPGDGITYPSTAENMLYPPGIPRRPVGPVSTRLPDGAIQGSPGREEGEVPETDIDPDTRRRLLILQHGCPWRRVAWRRRGDEPSSTKSEISGVSLGTRIAFF
jgi:hypothetical protein